MTNGEANDGKPQRDGARDNAGDLRGAGQLALEATKGITAVVEAMHRTIASGPDILGRPLEGPVRLITGLIYGGIRTVTDLVGSGVEQALLQLAPLLGESAPGREREAVLAALNGVLGDFLAESGNPLAIAMRLRRDGRALQLDRDALSSAVPDAQPRVVVMVHGSCMNDLQWNSQGQHDHGVVLARHLDATTVSLHYNSGLHVSQNGRAFADLLEQLVAAWPVPLQQLTLVTHSMGGLVSRSACHHAEGSGQRWRALLKHLVFLGTPHHGAPLERGGNWIDVLLGVSRYSAPLAQLGKIRSAGVTDLRYGTVLAEDWHGRDRFALGADVRHPLPLPAGVASFAAAATTAPSPQPDLPGDGLVPVDSALGRHADAQHTLMFPEGHTSIAFGMGHLDLVSRSEIADTLVAWLR